MADSWSHSLYRKTFVFISVPLQVPIKYSLYQVVSKGPVSSSMLCKTRVMKRLGRI